MKNKTAGILFSGGKDSCYATYLAKKQGYEIACLISIFSENKESYMFHTPSIFKVKEQAKIMDIPLIIQETKGEKEIELSDLKKVINQAKDRYNINTLVTGAIKSEYQASRVKKICGELNLECFNPLWQKDEFKYFEELIENNFEIVIVGVAADGLGKEWLGKTVNKENFLKLKKLRDEFKFHLAFEGGEAETFVTDCPLFNKKIKIIKGDKIWDGVSGRYDIKDIELVDK